MPQDATYWESRLIDDVERDWGYGEENWVKDYIKSVDHPHRDLVLRTLRLLKPWDSLLEIGCNAGPNLIRINKRYKKKILAGIDVSKDAIDEAKKHLSETEVDLRVGNILSLPYPDKLFDVILIDAVLMYIPPEDIRQAMNEINRVVRNGVILIERFSEKDSNNGYIWARDYHKLLKNLGFSVGEIFITKETWPTSENWQKHGRLFIGRR